MSISELKNNVVVDLEAVSSGSSVVGETQKLRVQFSTFSLVSLGFSVACSWGGYGSSIGATFLYGGAPAVVWTFPIASLYMGFVAVGMAELASAYPSTGGQYHWVYMIAPKNSRVFLSFLCGWTLTVASWFAGCSLSQICAGFTLNMASLNNPDYVSTDWQAYLVYVLYYCLATAVNVFASKWLSQINNIIMGFSIAGLVVSFLSILICHKAGFRSNSFVWTDYTNSTGWKSDGLTFLLAVGNACFSLLGADSASHLTDEIQLPGKKIPIAMIIPSILGFITAWPFAIALAYCSPSLDTIMNASFPITEVYYAATNNVGLTIFCVFLNMVTMFGGLIGSLQACSRSSAALARDGGMPFPGFFGHIDKTWRVPLNAMILEGAFVVLYGLAQLGSSAAFLAAVNALCLFMMSSYCIPQAILLCRGRSILPPRYLDLGFYFGYFVNISSVALTAMYVVLFCFPSVRAITVQNMNWVSVTGAGLAVLVVIAWFVGLKKTYHGPDLDEDKISYLREEALQTLESNNSVL